MDINQLTNWSSCCIFVGSWFLNWNLWQVNQHELYMNCQTVHGQLVQMVNGYIPDGHCSIKMFTHLLVSLKKLHRSLFPAFLCVPFSFSCSGLAKSTNPYRSLDLWLCALRIVFLSLQCQWLSAVPLAHYNCVCWACRISAPTWISCDSVLRTAL